MEIENCIEYLNQIRGCIPNSFITEPIDEIIKRLKILEELKKSISPGGVIEIDYRNDEALPDASGIRFVCKWLDKLERKYFPRNIKRNIIIEIKAEDEEKFNYAVNCIRYHNIFFNKYTKGVTRKIKEEGD